MTKGIKVEELGIVEIITDEKSIFLPGIVN